MCLSNVTSMFSTKMPAVPTLPAAPKMSDPEIENAKRRELLRLSNMKGRSASILTGGQGDTSAAPVAYKTLMGQ